MGMTNDERRALKGNIRLGSGNFTAPTVADVTPLEPIAMRIPEATRFSGFSRSEIYRRAGTGEIILRKCGATTLVDVTSLRSAVAALPRAVIRSR